MKRKKIKTKASALILTAFFAAALNPGSLSVQAAVKSPVTEYDAQTLAKLADDRLEYWEIPGLIEQYNIAFRNQLASFYDSPDGGSMGLTKEQMLSLAAELREEAKEIHYDAEEMKPDLTPAEYKEYKANVSALRGYAKQLEDAANGKSAAGLSQIRELRILREKQTVSACEKMREYQKLSAQTQIAEKKLEIAELTLESARRQQELGLYAAEDVLDAEEGLNAAQAAFSSAEAAAKSGKQDLLVMLGWRYDANPQIETVPKPEEEKLAGFHPDTDSAKAIENNYTLSETRRTASTAQGGAVAKARKIQEQENQVRMNLDALYQAALYKQSAYQSARLEFDAAVADKAAADRKNALGMSSRQEYLAAEAAFLACEADYEAAGLDLTAAIEQYEWAMRGLMEIGGQE
ncbi:MAG: hypothetical protein HFE84_03095 [Lachnospiraceae bacterium]|nr:hypothetical protein [Lachnospiraceae bacterium]